VQSFDQLHPGIQKGYQENCATCHASCGSCHVNRPPAAGGGPLNGHDFAAPTMRDNCTACHSSRGGHAYYGVGTGTKPDVHLTEAGFDCMDCHAVGEMHATRGKIYPRRYTVEELPDCKDCHASAAEKNPYHTTHWEDFNCQVCHSQDYNTCGSCHVAGEGARIHSHQSFKIGINPISADRPYKFSTVRRTLAAPDSWELFGVPQLPSFNSKPIYNYTTPHNIQRWTSRTQFKQFGACHAQCHISYELGTYKNRGLYLFSSDFLTEWERNATRGVVVDGKLPRSWGNPS
jgi:thiosulfate/3-mercaptopyruvate sulfurtransferase